MKTILYTITIVLLTNISTCFGQDSLLVGKKYFEDQLFVGVTYNILTNRPTELQQKGLSTGVQIGFIKDIPLNKRGTTALGIGFGYGYSKFSHNLRINERSETIPEFELLDETNYNNKFETHSLDFPIELRIHRSSSPTVYKFLRVYLGAKISYVFSSRSYYSDTDISTDLKPLPYVNKWQYGPYFLIGWGTWNLYAYYNANNIFDSAPTSDAINPNDLKSLKIGLQFYIF